MEPLRKDYLEEVLEATMNTRTETHVQRKLPNDEKIVALLIQNNLLLDKLCNLMFVATGIPEHDIPQDLGDTEPGIDISKMHGVICGQCGKGVAPNRMGYCPKCGHDLKKQVAMEATRLKED